MKLKNTAILLAAFALLLILPAAGLAQKTAQKKPGKWVKLTDGKSFKGWKIAEPAVNSWKIEEGAFVAQGPRSHLYYVGDPKPFVNFELQLEVMTGPVSNGGIYIHTAWQETGFPKAGYEIQVNQSHGDWRKSGSIYSVNDVKEVFVKDNEWYKYNVIVEGKHIIVKLNDKVVNDWTEEADRQPGKDFTRILSSGTFALQAHDPKSVVKYKNIQVRRF
ncbi:MAG: 3-keto-disaccharide hydrolase [Blastocatellia bacterium]